jgi:hypothetical protein
MHELVSLYRSALRSGNRPLADALARVVRADPELRERVDLELQELPRGQARWSPAGEAAVRAVMCRIAGCSA